MRILYINHYAGSLQHGMEFRPYYLAREWIRQGHQVEIVAASFSHVRGKQPPVSGIYTEQEIDGIQYLWCQTPNYHGNGVGRVKNIFTFLWRVWRRRQHWQGDAKPNIVIASSTYPLDIFVAWWIARRNGAKLIFEVHDLWPLSPIELGGMSRWHPFIMLLQLAEDFAYRFSDQVVSMLPLAGEYMYSRGLKPDKFFHIPNGIDLTEWRQPKSVEIPQEIYRQLETERKSGRFTVAYVGAHGIANALEKLIEAARILENEKVSFFLIGPGPEKANLKSLAIQKKVKNIFFFDSVPKLAVPTLLKEFDILYIGLQSQSLFRFGISPNKMMDYMAAGKPVVNAIESGNDPISDAGCGITVKSGEPSKIAEALLQLTRIPKSEREQMGEKGRRYVEQHHSYEALAASFLDITQ